MKYPLRHPCENAFRCSYFSHTVPPFKGMIVPLLCPYFVYEISSPGPSRTLYHENSQDTRIALTHEARRSLIQTFQQVFFRVSSCFVSVRVISWFQFLKPQPRNTRTDTKRNARKKSAPAFLHSARSAMLVEMHQKKNLAPLGAEPSVTHLTERDDSDAPPLYKRFAPAGTGRDRSDIISSEIFLFESAVARSLTLLPVLS